MGNKLSWSLNAGAPGGSLDQSGSIDCDAITNVAITIDATENKALELQLADVSNLVFLAIKSSIYDKKVKIEASGAGATEIELSGPVFLYGAAIALLGPSLETLTITNTHATEAAEIDILIATKVI
jgi:hypothetical protein